MLTKRRPPGSGSVRQLPSGAYQARFSYGGRQSSRTMDSMAAAQAWLKKQRDAVTEGVWEPPAMVVEVPAEAADHTVPGHWEGDLNIGTGRSAIGTLVERSSRSTLLVHLPGPDGWQDNASVRNGPSLGSTGAVAMNAALTTSITQPPQQQRKTLTWDRGKELSGHAQFALETGTRVFFADPYSPWQRPTNEYTNGLLRQYFPKGTDLSHRSAEDLQAVANSLSNRPRKALNWKTPAEVFDEQLRSLQPPGVASSAFNTPYWLRQR